MKIRQIILESTARVFRTLPRIKGKYRIGRILQGRLIDCNEECESLKTFKMKNGLQMKVDLRTRTEAPAYWTGEYDSRQIQQVIEFLPDGAIALDVGANIGFWSISLGRALKEKKGRLYSFEPMPANFKRLVENIQLNALEDVITPVKSALGDRECTVGMNRGEGVKNSSGNADVQRADITTVPEETVAMTRLDSFFPVNSLSRCEFIKVDIEGSEFSFLKGALNFLRTHQPVILTELNYPYMEHFGWTFDSFCSMMVPLGYDVFREKGSVFIPANGPGTYIEMALLIPKSGKLAERARKCFM